MSTGTGPPAITKITLTYDDDGDYWVATDEQTGVTAQAPTREMALAALDDAIANRTDGEEREGEIPPDDPFFTAPTFASGKSDISENVDAYLVASSDRTSSDAPDEA